MSECVSCGIVRGEVEASLVYENDVCVVAMDLLPVNEGHALVPPRQHARLVAELDAATRAHVLVKEGGWASPQPRHVLDSAAERIRGVWS